MAHNEADYMQASMAKRYADAARHVDETGPGRGTPSVAENTLQNVIDKFYLDLKIMHEIDAGVKKIRDALVGSEPECATDATKEARYPGKIGELLSLHDQVRSRLLDIQRHLSAINSAL